MKSYFLRQINIILIIVSIISLNGCGIYKYTDANEVSPDPGERVKKNIEEGMKCHSSVWGFGPQNPAGKPMMPLSMH